MSQIFDKKLNVRINHKYDTYENWKDSDVILGKGEIAVAEVYTDETGLTPPAIGIKIGNGSAVFKNLPWIQSTAGDVYAWAKETSPDILLTKKDLSGNFVYEEFINQITQLVKEKADDTNTKYEFIIAEEDLYDEDNTTLLAPKGSIVINSIDKTIDSEIKTYVATIDFTKKVNKVVDGVAGNLVSLTEDGDIADSGKKISDYLTITEASNTYETKETVSSLTERVGTIDSALQTAVGYINDLDLTINGDDGLVAQISSLDNIVNGTGEDSIAQKISTAVADGIADVVDGAPDAFDTLKEIAEWIQGTDTGSDAGGVIAQINSLQDRVESINSIVGSNKAGEESGLVKENITNKANISANTTAIGENTNKILANTTAINNNAADIANIKTELYGDEDTEQKGLKDKLSDLEELVSGGKEDWNNAVQNVTVNGEDKYTTRTDNNVVSINAIPISILDNVEGFTLLFDCGNAQGFSSNNS